MGVSREQSAPYFLKNKHFLPPDTYMCVYVSGGKKCSFFGKFGVLCFLETPVLRFALLPYYRRPDIDENMPSQRNDSTDGNNDTINSDVIAKNDKTMLFKNKLLEDVI